jgi:hypothetical protein
MPSSMAGVVKDIEDAARTLGMQLQLVPTDGPDDMAKDQLGPAGSAAASSDSGSDECRRGLMPATLMRCVKSQ